MNFIISHPIFDLVEEIARLRIRAKSTTFRLISSLKIGSLPICSPGIESDDVDSVDDDTSISLPEFESFYVDYPNSGNSTIDVVEDIPIAECEDSQFCHCFQEFTSSESFGNPISNLID
ncbi:hypothetical protein Tco_0157543 [Tanacetum coccineum]